MKRFLVVPVAVAAGLIISGVVGGASAQVPGIDSVSKSITVLGVGYGGQVPAKSTVSSRRGEYKAALEDAMDDAQAKAVVVAEKAGLSLGAVNEVTEDSSAAVCGSPKTKTTCSMRANVTVNFAVS
jgi:Protein of unknown function (DUF541)